MLSPNSLFGLLKSNIYTIVVPLVVAAFVWMCVGVLDNECKRSDSVKFVKRVHIAFGILATVYAGLHILKLTL